MAQKNRSSKRTSDSQTDTINASPKDNRDSRLAKEKQIIAGDRINSLLQAADCASALLSDEDFERSVNKALEILGTSVNADRLGIGEQHDDSTGKTLGHVIVRYQWLSFNTISQVSHPKLSRIDCEEFADDYHKLISGNHCEGLIETYSEPFRSGQELGVKATYAIPIIIKEQYWGFINLDFCQTARELSDEEVAVLKTAATCIGSAIQRERNRQTKEQAERTALLEQQKAEELQDRNRLLNITARAAQALLNNENLSIAIAQALQIVGEGIDTDRLAVMEHCEDSTGDLGYLEMLFEWHSPDAVSQLHHQDLHQISYEGIEDWYEQFKRGEAMGGTIDKLPEAVRSGQLEIGVKSTYSIPILVDGQYWGVVGIDDCRQAKQPSETEISILKTTAACIGSAIQQSRISKEREQAERNALLERQKAAQLAEHNQVLEKRDRILSATAEASNILLTEKNFDEAVNKALKIIGESINTDRVAVLENFDDLSGQSFGYLEVIYEWDSIYAVSQMNHPEVSQISHEGIEEWYFLLCRGEWTGGVLNELPEPFGSSMEKIDVKATYGIPIMVDRKFWGIVGIDDCREETRRSEAELSILKTAAACIGGAIQQERIRRAKEEAERNILLEREKTATEKAVQLAQSNQILSLRDRWLEATANAANKLLKIADLDEGINAALKVLGESLDCDRVCVIQNIEDLIGQSLGFMRCLYEWNSDYATPQIDRPEFKEFSKNGLEDWFAKMIDGNYVGGTFNELPEAYHSALIELEIQSTYNVGIFTNNQFWGILGIDRCGEPKCLTSAEIAVFKTAASCVGSAIYRQQIQQEKEQAELAILDERNRMAREIHDTLAQAFTGISLQLEVAKNTLTTQPEAAQERLLRAKNLAQEGINEARRSVRALRPQALESSDLITALRQLINKMVSGAEIDAEILVEGQPIALNPEIEVELFRIAQEALTNTLRYAGASEICIQLIYETDTIHLQIKDNGIGFNVRSQANIGFGLMGMRERCDRLNCNLIINSAVGEGTTIIVTVSKLGSRGAREEFRI